ncbi:hypothetical protein MUK42_07549 [Musa troglodytarum]|uniref:Uncharacterized protein n=1 Tax=Musa troglodytarum TaxID=320322 RepID=A0A9E7GAM6_9LILI|nr:hypothetical protein MUK42_07549 [Musa troglodytarum]
MSIVRPSAGEWNSSPSTKRVIKEEEDVERGRKVTNADHLLLPLRPPHVRADEAPSSSPAPWRVERPPLRLPLLVASGRFQRSLSEPRWSIHPRVLPASPSALSAPGSSLSCLFYIYEGSRMPLKFVTIITSDMAVSGETTGNCVSYHLDVEFTSDVKSPCNQLQLLVLLVDQMALLNASGVLVLASLSLAIKCSVKCLLEIPPVLYAERVLHLALIAKAQASVQNGWRNLGPPAE